MSAEGEINFFHPVALYLNNLSIQRLTTQLQSQAIASRLDAAHHGVPVVVRALTGGFTGLLRHTKGKEGWRDGNDGLGHLVRQLEGSDWSQPFSLARKPHLKSCKGVKDTQPELQLTGKVTSWHLSRKGQSLYPQTRNTAVHMLAFHPRIMSACHH